MSGGRQGKDHAARNWLVLAVMVSALVGLAARAVYLQVFNASFLRSQGNARYSRLVKDNSHRGMILDRHGAPLAVSTPVDSVWAYPPALALARRDWPALAARLGMGVRELAQDVARSKGREFMYLRRQLPPDIARRVMALKVPGVSLVREYRRYYPLGAVAGHVLGFTNVDDQGQEGIELAYDSWLRATPGEKRVLKDLQGNAVEVEDNVVLPKPGRDLVVSLDARIQYLAFRALRAAVRAHQAHAGSAVVLDARTGEVLAMVDEPEFNPNDRSQLHGRVYRNRAVTDLFEPGSTIKPFTIACALESGKYTPNTPIETAPGFIRVGDNTISDVSDFGLLSVTGVIEKSSNVGATKIALSLNKHRMWRMLRAVGFGSPTGSDLPGEVAGLLNPPGSWMPIEQATISFGYGVAVTPLQLARAYGALADGGVLRPVTLLRQDAPLPGTRVIPRAITRAIRPMLELAASREGTGAAADVPDYRVAGKTGTVRKLTSKGYSQRRYVAWFAGFAPASAPRLVMVVTIDQPRRGGYYGGEVAAPVFAQVMTGALRLLDVAPDAPRNIGRPLITARTGKVAP